MSRVVLFACLLMFVAAAVCLDMPPNLKINAEPPKDSHLPVGHPPHPDLQHKSDGQHLDAPRHESGQTPKDKTDAKASQDSKS